MRKIFLGHILNPVHDKKAQLVMDGALITRKGKVLGIEKRSRLKIQAADEVIDYTGHVIMPPFFDMHFHWVQDDVREMPKANLLHWLENFTFPAEKKFASKNYARKKAKEFFQRLINVGTLGGACYSSIHEHALEYAMEEVTGDFVMGNVLMTMNSPKYLTQTPKAALASVKKLSKKYKNRYALTPRFAIATDPETMSKTAQAIKGKGCFIQTHLSETKNEINFVTGLYQQYPEFKGIKTYTEIYDRVNHLGPRTIMGHGIHLQKSELIKLAHTKTILAHCPTSNAPLRQKGLGSGLFDFKTVEKYGIRWALASDIGGGPFLSMFDVMRSFVSQNEKAGVKGASYTKAFYRATLAGAESLGVSRRVGCLTPGKEANFIVVRKKNLKGLKSAESVLAKLTKSCARNRRDYDHMLQAVYRKSDLISSI